MLPDNPMPLPSILSGIGLGVLLRKTASRAFILSIFSRLITELPNDPAGLLPDDLRPLGFPAAKLSSADTLSMSSIFIGSSPKSSFTVLGLLDFVRGLLLLESCAGKSKTTWSIGLLTKGLIGCGLLRLLDCDGLASVSIKLSFAKSIINFLPGELVPVDVARSFKILSMIDVLAELDLAGDADLARLPDFLLASVVRLITLDDIFY